MSYQLKQQVVFAVVDEHGQIPMVPCQHSRDNTNGWALCIFPSRDDAEKFKHPSDYTKPIMSIVKVKIVEQEEE